jgi:Ribonuclease G/E
MANKMLIDATHPEETRVVVLRGNRVEEFDFESAHRKQLRGNIYLAKVTRVEPSLQAAFVDYGGNRHGFLAFSEIHPDYYQIPIADRQALIAEEERAQRAAADEVDRAPRRARGAAASARRDEDAIRSDGAAPAEPLGGDVIEAETSSTAIEPEVTDIGFEPPTGAPDEEIVAPAFEMHAPEAPAGGASADESCIKRRRSKRQITTPTWRKARRKIQRRTWRNRTWRNRSWRKMWPNRCPQQTPTTKARLLSRWGRLRTMARKRRQTTLSNR